ncbi:transcription factor Dp-2-like [Zophobas morio]|uniref:transcription factor Dp-2-like n=1 Tax=Zophobas morio TaxID=2755281 RepID=UPI003082E51B
MAHIGGKKDKEPIAGTLLRLVCIHRVFIYYRLPSHSFFAVDTSNNTLKHFTLRQVYSLLGTGMSALNFKDSFKSKRASVKGTDKGGKGLRFFAMKVCQILQFKGKATYVEVAEELVTELCLPSYRDPLFGPLSSDLPEPKNIKRRVYDVLKVLLAMNIVSKEKKVFKWSGLPSSSSQESVFLKDKKLCLERSVRQKRVLLKELLVQQVSFKNLLFRNTGAQQQRGPPRIKERIHLPFILLCASSETQIDCEVDKDACHYVFRLNGPFRLCDETELLQRMGLSLGLETDTNAREAIKKCKSLVPPPVTSYFEGVNGRNHLEQDTPSSSLD